MCFGLSSPTFSHIFHIHALFSLQLNKAGEFGLALRHFSSALKEATGSMKIYTLFFSESSPHLHIHLVPRTADFPKEYIAPSTMDMVLDLMKDKRAPADPERVVEIIAKLKTILADRGSPSATSSGL